MKTLFIILYSCFSLLNHSHPLHVSVMNIEQDKTDNALIVSVKLYTDDLEKIIEKKYNVSLQIGKPMENNKWAEYIQKYLSEQVAVKINNGKVTDIRNLSRMAEDDALWITYRIPASADIQKIEIQNTLLFDMYYDQTNLLMLTYKGKDFSKKLDNHDAVMTVYFTP